MEANKKLTIAIDGFSSCGKSTVAKQLAKQLGYTYIDTGAMYRTVSLYCLRNGWVTDSIINAIELEKAISDIKIHFTYNKDEEKYLTWMNDELVESEIRTIKIANIVSLVSTLDFVRTAMVDQQRIMGAKGGVVMDGRDIGTVVFPNADLKIFMTASVEIRAKRRFDELMEKGDDITFKEVADNISQRDYIDQNRDIAPLRKADDAVEIDNGNLTHEEQFTKILALVNERVNLKR